MAGAARNYPIIIMAFDRPDYFAQVLDSLLRQQGVDLASRSITLFQDGCFNEHSRKDHADPEDIAGSIAVFRERFPKGRVAHSLVNLGVALNFDRAERWVFEEVGAEAAIFLEDDMVLSPHYIRTIDRMLDMAMEDTRIGYVAAYGDWNRPLEKQREFPGRFLPLLQNWAFGLTRHQWRKNQNFMEQYLPFVRGIDYRARPHTKIYDLYTSHGMARVESSQDRAKLIACVLTGGVRLNTTACLAQYIGAVGLHSKAADYARSGCARTEIYPDGNFEFERLTHAAYHRLMAEQAAAVEAKSPVLDKNAPLTFNIDGTGLRGLRQSFYQPEGWGVWSGNARSVVSVKLPVRREAGPRTLWITGAHFAHSAKEEVEVEVRGNGGALGTIHLGHVHKRAALPLPAGVERDDGALELEFCSPVTGCPQEAGFAQDARRLSVGLVKLELE